MKYILATVILSSLTTIIYGQNKIETYCEVTSSIIGLSRNLRANVSFGIENTPLADSSKRNEIINFFMIHKFQAHADILNYMSSKGWTLRSSCVDASKNVPQYIFFFKKDY